MNFPSEIVITKEKYFIVDYNKLKQDFDLIPVRYRTFRILKAEFIKATIEETIINFFKHYNRKYYTIDLKGSVVCNPNKHRSSGDLWKILLVYYPDITLEEVMKILFNLCKDDKLRMTFCYQIKKRVFDVFWDYAGNRQSLYQKQDEYGLSFHEWNKL